RSYGDWSSDVCSSDLCPWSADQRPTRRISSDHLHARQSRDALQRNLSDSPVRLHHDGELVARSVGIKTDVAFLHLHLVLEVHIQIGRASCRERVEVSL